MAGSMIGAEARSERFTWVRCCWWQKGSPVKDSLSAPSVRPSRWCRLDTDTSEGPSCRQNTAAAAEESGKVGLRASTCQGHSGIVRSAQPSGWCKAHTDETDGPSCRHNKAAADGVRQGVGEEQQQLRPFRNCKYRAVLHGTVRW